MTSREPQLNAEKIRKITIERTEKFISTSSWTDINLASKIYGHTTTHGVHLNVWSISPTNENETDAVSFKEMLQQPQESFKPATIGQTFGPEWSTHWFRVDISLSSLFAGKEVHFVWDSTGEALLFDNGMPVQAFNGSTGNDRRDFHVLTLNAKGDEQFSFYIEMAACGMFGNSSGEFLSPPNGSKIFTLNKAELRVFNRQAYNLWTDLTTLLQMAQNLPYDDVRAWGAVETMRKVVNECHTDRPETWPAAQKIASIFLNQKNGDGQHEITATGHCHIDTAWLWPYSETRRKVARSWATQCRLMDFYPTFKFAASQAQQYEWMKDNYPEFYTQILLPKIKSGQFIPIGGTWIEMDCNIPSGESFARQFLLGQSYFQKEFGITCKVFWLPDTFGYSSQLPQIMKQSGCEYFLTQKLSWNNINKFPHNTFWWEGLDGTSVLSHFPPADTYVAEANVKHIVEGTRNFKTKDKSNCSMMLFGWGDGGGGPDPNHIERLLKISDVSGVPKITMGHPEDYFNKVMTEGTEIPRWVGELYFELHRGTYTTHASNKLGNRKNELMLTAVEFLGAIAASPTFKTKSDFRYPHEQLTHLWKLLLLNQFHDVLPGTSIGLVYKDSAKHYQEIAFSVEKLRRSALTGILGVAQDPSVAPPSQAAFNILSWHRKAVIELDPIGYQTQERSTSASSSSSSSQPQAAWNGKKLAIVEVPSLGFSEIISTNGSSSPASSDSKASESPSSSISMEGPDDIILKNKFIETIFDHRGRCKSLMHLETGRQAICPGQLGNTFVLFDDVPFFWDAWDVEIYHTEKQVPILGYTLDKIPQNHEVKIIESGPIRVGFEYSLDISHASRITQRVFLDAVSDILTFETHVAWNENRKFLKVEFPLDIRSTNAWYSTQFGCQSRPTHKNTTWDMAKFEVCAHHWADLNEFGFGVALLNDSKYGYSCIDNNIRLSLLRSSKQPDDKADMGLHTFSYGLLAHKGSHLDSNLARRGLEFNQPLQLVHVPNDHISRSFFSFINVDDKFSLILETIKAAEPLTDCKKCGVVVLRLWESAGGRGKAIIHSSIPLTKVVHVDILERPVANNAKKINLDKNGNFEFQFMPFEVITLACHLANE